MLEKLRALNPELKIHSIHDAAFKKYGRVIDNLPVCQVTEILERLEMPAEGSVYVAELPELMATADAKAIGRRFFGETACEVGVCYGYNSQMNAMEWHRCSELNVAVTPLVLLLGDVRDVEGGEYDAGRVEAFYLEKGAVVEVYGPTLHFCPCQVSEAGFICLVGLTKGTNLPLEEASEDRLLFRKNKWLICHEYNRGLIERGVYPGIHGENYTVKY